MRSPGATSRVSPAIVMTPAPVITKQNSCLGCVCGKTPPPTPTSNPFAISRERPPRGRAAAEVARRIPPGVRAARASGPNADRGGADLGPHGHVGRSPVPADGQEVRGGTELGDLLLQCLDRDGEAHAVIV